METYERVAWHDRHRRRTAMDALEVLRAKAGLQDWNEAVFHVLEFRLLSGNTIGLIDLRYEQPSSATIAIVSLPTSSYFHAIRRETGKRGRFEIALLNGARIDGFGNTHLSDGTKLRAIEVSPAVLAEPSELDWRIVHLTLELVKAKGCYRSLREGLPADQQNGVQDEFYLDCTRLSGLELPPLKSIQRHIAERDWTLRKLSATQIADSLQKFGIRRPESRARRNI